MDAQDELSVAHELKRLVETAVNNGAPFVVVDVQRLLTVLDLATRPHD